MALARRGVVSLLLAAMAGLLFSGCVTAKKYRLAKGDIPPPVPLEWQTGSGEIGLTLRTLIVFKGPGSWKREARWDEYVVSLANRGRAPFVLGDAELIDALGQSQRPGADPWKLERLSYTNWEIYGKAGLKVVAGAGALVAYSAAAYGVAYAGMLGGASSATAEAIMFGAVPVIAIVHVTTVVVLNHRNKEAIATEFARRRLVLPATIAPGRTVGGSLFFPMVPGPQRLIVRGMAGDVPIELALDLKPLASLHLETSGK